MIRAWMSRSVASLLLAASVVAAALLIIGCAAPPSVGSPSASAVRPDASPSPSVGTASPAPTPAGALGLAVGGSRLLTCDGEFPSFSPDARWLACGRQLLSWPDLATVATLAGAPGGWSARGQLLVLMDSKQYSLVTPRGATVDLKLSPGDMPEWSSDGLRLLIHGDPRIDGRLRLAVWIAFGAPPQALVDLPAAGATRIDLSSDGNTVLRSSMSCSIGGSGNASAADCRFALIASRPDGSGAVPFGPVKDGASFPRLVADGGYWFALGAGTQVAVWAASPGGAPRFLGEMRGYWPLADGGFAAADAAGLWRWHPGAAALARVALPTGVEPGAILSLAPDLGQALIGSQGSTAFVDLASGTRIAGPDWTLATAEWIPDGAFGVVFSGPPPTSMIVRLR